NSGKDLLPAIFAGYREQDQPHGVPDQEGLGADRRRYRRADAEVGTVRTSGSLTGRPQRQPGMSRAFLSVILCLAVAGCGGSDPSTNRGGGERSVQNSALTRLSLISSAFQEGQPIPAEFTCDGANRSPALSWGDPPAGTKSFALVVDDPDAPGGLFRHWGA